MAKKKINIRLFPGGTMPAKQNGNWYDCTTRKLSKMKLGRDMEMEVSSTQGIVQVNPGDILISYLGFATDLGKGYEAQLKPRSSTFKKYGLLQGNAVGLIDDSYCGNNDEWMVYWYCTRSVRIPVNARLCQMTIEKSNPEVEFNLVEDLGNEDRGGFGTTGK